MTLLAAVERAVLAPSVHNTQPWRFVIQPGALEIYADLQRKLAVLDPTGRQLHISVGCAVLNARVSLAASGRGVSTHRLPDPARPVLVARLEVEAGLPPDTALAALDAVVEQRQTNRRRFAADTVPDDLVDGLVAAAELEGAILRPIKDAADRQSLARLSRQADIQQITSAAYRAEVRAWTSDDPTRRDGVRAAVVPHVDGTAEDDLPIRDFDSHGAGWLPPDTGSSVNQCLLVLGTEADDPLAWLRAGEALERVWLEITRAHYVASLFTQVIEVAQLRVQLREELRLGMQPHIVLRVGRAPVTAASLRRHVTEVLDVAPPG